MVNHPLESILDDYKICITGNSGAPGRKKGGSRYRYNPGISGLRCGSDLLRSPAPGPGEIVLNQPLNNNIICMNNSYGHVADTVEGSFCFYFSRNHDDEASSLMS